MIARGFGKLGRETLRITAVAGILCGVVQMAAYDGYSTITVPVEKIEAATGSDSCPAWTKCPLDGAQSNLTRTEYEGLTAIGVYEHTTSTGETHRFRMRCN
jgi:hypothetical protein